MTASPGHAEHDPPRLRWADVGGLEAARLRARLGNLLHARDPYSRRQATRGLWLTGAGLGLATAAAGALARAHGHGTAGETAGDRLPLAWALMGTLVLDVVRRGAAGRETGRRRLWRHTYQRAGAGALTLALLELPRVVGAGLGGGLLLGGLLGPVLGGRSWGAAALTGLLGAAALWAADAAGARARTRRLVGLAALGAVGLAVADVLLSLADPGTAMAHLGPRALLPELWTVWVAPDTGGGLLGGIGASLAALGLSVWQRTRWWQHPHAEADAPARDVARATASAARSGTRPKVGGRVAGASARARDARQAPLQPVHRVLARAEWGRYGRWLRAEWLVVCWMSTSLAAGGVALALGPPAMRQLLLGVPVVTRLLAVMLLALPVLVTTEIAWRDLATRVRQTRPSLGSARDVVRARATVAGTTLGVFGTLALGGVTIALGARGAEAASLLVAGLASALGTLGLGGLGMAVLIRARLDTGVGGRVSRYVLSVVALVALGSLPALLSAPLAFGAGALALGMAVRQLDAVSFDSPPASGGGAAGLAGAP